MKSKKNEETFWIISGSRIKKVKMKVNVANPEEFFNIFRDLLQTYNGLTDKETVDKWAAMLKKPIGYEHV